MKIANRFQTIIGLFIIIVCSGSLASNVKVSVQKHDFKYGERLIIPIVLENCTMDAIEVDTQPFYLLAVGSKGADNIEVCSSSSSNLNKIYISEETCGGIRFNHIDGHLIYAYFDSGLQRIALLKPKEKIKINLVLEWSLYQKYFSKGLWEVNAVVAWQKSQKVDDDTDKVVGKKNYENVCEIPIVKNYYSFFLRNKPSRESMKKFLLRRYFLNASESGVFKISVE